MSRRPATILRAGIVTVAMANLVLARVFVLRWQPSTRSGTTPADGTPLTDVEPERAPPDGWGNELLDGEGRFTVAVGPRPEPWIVVTPSRFTPRPAGRITVLVRDANDRPIDAMVWLDLLRIAGADGAHEIRGVHAGAFSLVVGARGHRGKTRRIDLAEGERLRVEVTLRHRR